jgi:HK97 family phage portal protein
MGLKQRLATTLERWSKSLYDLHPELAEREPLLRLRSDEEAASGGGYQEGADHYVANVWLRRAVSVVANNLAPLPLAIQDRRTKETTYDHDLIDLFFHVNDSMDSIDLWRQWTTDMLIGGESGFEVARNGRDVPIEVWVRQPHTFSVRVAKGPDRRYGGVVGYHVEDNLGDPYDVDPESFVHFKFYNPENPWRGLSPVAAIRMGILIDEFARAWARMFFKNAARPDLAIIAPHGLTEYERNEIERKFTAKFAGVDNAHKVVALEKGITDIKSFDHAPKDTEWLQQREFSRDEIAAMIGVPDEIMGYGRNTYENFGTAMRVLWTLTIMPIAQSRDATLTEWAKRNGLLERNEQIVTDFSDVPELQEDRSQQVQDYRGLVEGMVPPNQAAQTVGLDIEDIPGGDVGYRSITLVPITSGALPSRSEGELEAPRPVMKEVTFGSPEHAYIWKKKIKRVEKYESTMMRMLARALQAQQNEVNRRLRNTEGHELGRGYVEGNVIKARALVKQNILNLFDPYKEAERWRQEFGPMMAEALLDVGLEELQDLGLDIDFDLRRPEVQAELGEVLSNFARKVNDTTYNDLRQVFSQAEAEGAGIPEIMEMLGSYWEGRKSTASRERIARTTMTAVNNAGDEAAWNQADDVVIGSRWLAAIDERTRDTHVAAHGQGRRLNQMFDVGGTKLAYPGDPNGPPGEIINCRCTRTAILVGESIEE